MVVMWNGGKMVWWSGKELWWCCAVGMCGVDVRMKITEQGSRLKEE